MPTVPDFDVSDISLDIDLESLLYDIEDYLTSLTEDDLVAIHAELVKLAEKYDIEVDHDQLMQLVEGLKAYDWSSVDVDAVKLTLRAAVEELVEYLIEIVDPCELTAKITGVDIACGVQIPTMPTGVPTSSSGVPTSASGMTGSSGMSSSSGMNSSSMNAPTGSG